MNGENMKKLICILVSMISVNCTAIEVESIRNRVSKCESIQVVSLINVIANPEKYDGKCVRLTGVLRVEFEGNALFLNQESYKNDIYVNAVTLTFHKHIKDFFGDISELNGKYLSIEGIFTNEDINQNGATGYLGDIYRLTDFYNLFDPEFNP